MSPVQPLWLDYQRPLPGRNGPGFLLLAVGLLLAGLLLAQSMSITAELTATEQQVSRLKRESERRRLLASVGRQEQDAVTETRLSSPSASRWESLLTSLENAGNDSVTLLGLEPGSREISISGEARNLGAALDYVQRLQGASVFAEVHLARHEIVMENPYRPVRFTLQAGWREASQ